MRHLEPCLEEHYPCPACDEAAMCPLLGCCVECLAPGYVRGVDRVEDM